MIDFEQYSQDLLDMVLAYGPKLISAVIVLIIGLWLIRLFSRFFRKLLEKRDVDPSLRPFLRSLVVTLLRVMLVISVMGMAGIEMTSFIAILGAAGLAIGMALSGTLQNFAGGVMLLIFKPYKVGDFIEAQGYTGTVSEIQIFNTILKTPDNKVIIIPNGGISTNSLTNYSKEATRRVDFTFGIGYGDDLKKAKDIMSKCIEEDTRIMKDPEPFVALSEMADSSVNFVMRVWTKTEDYWGVYFDMQEKIYNEFNAGGINIPYPQMDLHVIKE